MQPSSGTAQRIAEAVLRGDDVSLNKACNQFLRDEPHNGQGLCALVQRRIDHRTPLMVAAQNGQVAIGNTLLAHGADPLVGEEAQGTSLYVVRKRDEQRLSTPMFLAARAGHGPFVILLHQHGVPLDDAMAACSTAIDAQLLRVLRQLGVPAKAFKPLLDAWVVRPGHAKEVELLLFATGVKPDGHTLLAAAEHSNPEVIGLLRDYGVAVGEPIRYRLDDGDVYRSEAQSRYAKVTALSKALNAMNFAPEPGRNTVLALLHAGAKPSSQDLTALINLRSVPLLQDALVFGARPRLEHLLLAAGKGELGMVASLLKQGSWTQDELADASTRAQSEGFARTANLLRARLALQALTPQSTWQSLRAWLPTQLLSGRDDASARASASEKNGYAPVEAPEVEAARRRYSLLLDAAHKAPSEGIDNALPVPGSSANAEQRLILRRS